MNNGQGNIGNSTWSSYASTPTHSPAQIQPNCNGDYYGNQGNYYGNNMQMQMQNHMQMQMQMQAAQVEQQPAQGGAFGYVREINDTNPQGYTNHASLLKYGLWLPKEKETAVHHFCMRK